MYDEDTGLVRFGYRDYDPKIGRWTARDPIGFKGRDTNWYAYVFNDPVRIIDPLGLVDLNLVTDKAADYLAAVGNGNDGVFDVGVHGGRDHFSETFSGSGKMSPVQLANSIFNSSNYEHGQTVKLWSCSAGNDRNGFGSLAADVAAELSRLTGEKQVIIAPTQMLGFTGEPSPNNQGKVYYGGSWATFTVNSQ